MPVNVAVEVVMQQDQEHVLTDLRIAVARLEENVKLISLKLDGERLYREQMDAKLAPLAESMNKGKGMLAAATLMAGITGAGIATVVKHVFHVPT